MPVLSDPAAFNPGPVVPGGTMRLILSKENVIVLIWRDKRVDDWDKVIGDMGPKAAGSVWSSRSLDGGKTWTDRQRFLKESEGHAPISRVQLKNRNLVVPVQYYASRSLRCVSQTYVSTEDGQTFTGRNIIDLSGRGDHDGAFQPSMVELHDDRVWVNPHELGSFLGSHL